VGLKTPEEELQQFLDAQPPWLRKILRLEPLSAEEKVAWVQSDWWWTLEGDTQIRNDYERLLRQIPGQWREYRKKVARNAQEMVRLSPGKPGRPRKDAEAAELQQQHQTKSYEQIAMGRLKATVGDKATKEQQKLAILKEKERVRKLIRSRSPRPVPPDKN
jgi:hypothetical protein